MKGYKKYSKKWQLKTFQIWFKKLIYASKKISTFQIRFTQASIHKHIVNSKMLRGKAAREKPLLIYKAASVRADFSSNTIKTRRQWSNRIKALKEKNMVNQQSYFWQNYLSKNEDKRLHRLNPNPVPAASRKLTRNTKGNSFNWMQVTPGSN